MSKEKVKKLEYKIESLENEICNLEEMIQYREEQMWNLAEENKSIKAKAALDEEKLVKSKKALVVSLDLWPLSDWLRFKMYGWNPGRYFQLTVGPIRIDIFEY